MLSSVIRFQQSGGRGLQPPVEMAQQAVVVAPLNPGLSQGLSKLFETMQVEEPTVRMTFSVNTSAFAGREGKFVTSRQIKERLDRELERNLALRVSPGESAESFIVSGRGALHLGILMENMRREGYEFAVGPPKVSMGVSNTARVGPALHGNQLICVCRTCELGAGSTRQGILLSAEAPMPAVLKCVQCQCSSKQEWLIKWLTFDSRCQISYENRVNAGQP